MTAVKPERKEDVIDRAGWLISHSYVLPGERGDAKRCQSQRLAEQQIYDVTFDSCTCYVGQYRKGRICKHRLACFGLSSVALILEMREAPDPDALRTLGEDYAEALAEEDESFVKLARIEYLKRMEELKGMAA